MFLFVFRSIRMSKLTLNELKLVTKSRDIKYYENKSDLRKILSETKIRTKANLSKRKIREIRKDFNKSNINVLNQKQKRSEKNLDNIKNTKTLSEPKIKKTEKSVYELKEILSKSINIMFMMMMLDI